VQNRGEGSGRKDGRESGRLSFPPSLVAFFAGYSGGYSITGQRRKKLKMHMNNLSPVNNELIP